MTIQKKLWTIIIIALLKIGLMAQLNAQQLNLVTPPDEYEDALEVVYDLYGGSIQITSNAIEDFMSLAISNLPYDSILPNPDANLIKISPESFILEWPGSSQVTEYKVSMIDLVTGDKENGVTNTPVYAADFLGDGPTLIVLQSISEYASRANIIIIDKMILYAVSVGHDCDCDKPGDIKNEISAESRFFPTIRGFSLQNTTCAIPQYQIAIKLLIDEEFITYNYSWEMNFEERQINLGNHDCSDPLIINFIPSEEFPEAFISEDRNLTIRLGENVLVVEAQTEGAYIANVDFDQCCDLERSAPASATESKQPIALLPVADFYSDLNVHPNPSRGKFDITFNLKEDRTVQFQLLSPQGIQLKEWTKAELSVGQQSFSFDVKDYPAGIYFLQVSSLNKKVLKKLVVLK